MIGIKELEQRINEILRIFSKRTKVLGCSLIDKDGFILSSIKPEHLDRHRYNKKILSLYMAVDSIADNDPDLLNFKEEKQLISIGIIDDFFNNGLMILIQSVGENVVFITLFPTLLDLDPIYSEFDKVIEELSVYFLDEKYDDLVQKIFKIV
ncbi:MAG: hypothetical protein ACOCT9_00220 [archaeon]